MAKDEAFIEGVYPWLEIPDEARFRTLEEHAQVLGLCLRDGFFVVYETAYRREELVVVPPDTIDLGLAQKSGHVVALYVKCFLIVGECHGILILSHGMVSKFGEHEGRGKLLVVVLQGFQGLFGLVLAQEDVVPCCGHVLVLPEDSLDLVHCRESLVELVLLQVEVDQREVDLVLLGELLQEVFISRDRKVVLSGHRIGDGQPVLVPVIGRIQFRSLFQSGLGILDVILVKVAEPEIVPGCIIGRISGSYGS